MKSSVEFDDKKYREATDYSMAYFLNIQPRDESEKIFYFMLDRINAKRYKGGIRSKRYVLGFEIGMVRD